MGYRLRIKSVLLLSAALLFSAEVFPQSSGHYNITPAPDIWYNGIDGIRVGLRLFGEMDDSFLDGPHRLDAGAWVGTHIPKNPLSYYLSLTEPLSGRYEAENELNIRLVSSYRTGYTRHGISLNKRWQPGFDEFDYTELSLRFSQEKLTDFSYRPYPQLWQQSWKSLAAIGLDKSVQFKAGRFYLNTELTQNLNESSRLFTQFKLNATQSVHFGKHFALRLRGFLGTVSDKAAPEYLFSYGFGQAQEWLESGFSRAKGTFPQSSLNSGLIQFAGGAHLRGYMKQEARLLKSGAAPAYTSIWSINSDFEFPNPINSALKSIKLVGNLMELRSYLFFDAARAYKDFPNGITDPYGGIFALADVGAGVQYGFNIPDYLGKDRGIFIRYDVPFWVSEPDFGEHNFKFRQLIGIGAFFNF